MKSSKILLPFFLASMFAASFAFAADESKTAACCAKAAKDGAACTHGCCVEAAKDGKNCAKCGGAGQITAKK
jgi:hypothetical protein